jgi:hypothetical protein
MAPLTNNEKKTPHCCQWQLLIGLKEIVAPLKVGKEETHCCQ